VHATDPNQRGGTEYVETLLADVDGDAVIAQHSFVAHLDTDGDTWPDVCEHAPLAPAFEDGVDHGRLTVT
jgi:hypothetical protein